MESPEQPHGVMFGRANCRRQQKSQREYAAGTELAWMNFSELNRRLPKLNNPANSTTKSQTLIFISDIFD